MRLLVLLQAAVPADQCGYHDGFQRLVSEGVLAHYEPLCYRSPEALADFPAFLRRAAEVFSDTGCDAVLLQFFHGSMSPPDAFIAEVRRRRPKALVITTSGDPFGRWFVRPPPCLVRATVASDLSFYTGLGHIARPALAAGARNIVLMPHGCCQVRFPAQAPPIVGDRPYDVVFIGSRQLGRNPLSFQATAARRRTAMAQALQQRFGKRFALFGRGWEGFPSWQGALAFDQQVRAMRQSHLVVGGFPATDAPYYLSDRPYIALASGVPFLDVLGPGCSSLLEPDRRVHAYTDVASLMRLADRLLNEDPVARNELARQASVWIAKAHTQWHRTRSMVTMACELRRHREGGSRMPPPAPDVLVHDVDSATLRLPTILRWEG